MNRDEMIDLADKMIQFGGSFSKCIGEAIHHADPFNLKTLEVAFGDLIKDFRRFL